MLPSKHSRASRGSAGFTLLEVLVALAVVAVLLSAIGALMASSTKGTRAIEHHLTLVETARAIQSTLPARDRLAVGTTSGVSAGHRWRLDVRPFDASLAGQKTSVPWIPQVVTVQVVAPDGTSFQVDTVRLRRRAE